MIQFQNEDNYNQRSHVNRLLTKSQDIGYFLKHGSCIIKVFNPYLTFCVVKYYNPGPLSNTETS